MRFLRAMAVASLAAGLLIAGAGCTNTVAAAPNTAHHTTSSTASAATTSATPQRTTAAAAPSTSTTQPRTTAPSTTTASTPFPGIWDITSWQAYRTAQAFVAQGHQPWLLDPESVVWAWAHRWTPVPTVHRISANTFQVTEPGTHTVYTIKGTRPDPDSATPIWVITSITHT